MKKSVLFLALWVPLLAQDWQTLPDGSVGAPTEFRGSDGSPIRAYIRKPKGAGKFPVVVILHGGGSDKKATDDLGSRTSEPTGNFVAAGWAVYAIDFRAPIQILQKIEWDDAIAAVETVRRLPFIDGSRLALMGGSHGGFVMAKVASRVEARCAILCAPAAIDLIELSKFVTAGGEMNKGLKKFMDDYEKEKGATFSQMEKDRAKYGYEWPLTEAPKVRCPMLFINGLHDPNSPIPVMEAYGKALRASGHEVESYFPENGPHGFYFGRPPDLPETIEATKREVAFLRKHFQ